MRAPPDRCCVVKNRFKIVACDSCACAMAARAAVPRGGTGHDVMCVHERRTEKPIWNLN